MGFVKAKIEIRPASVGTGIKASLKQLRSGPAKLTISIGGTAIKELAWSKGDKIEVLIGDGPDHGMLRFRKNNSAGQVECNERQFARGVTFLCLSLGHQDAFVNRSEASAWCQWEKLEDGYIEVVLPKWAEETAPRKALQATPAPAPERRPVGRPPLRGNVTASLMGDPAPGRREAVAKLGE